jgi:hypothetical protein
MRRVTAKGPTVVGGQLYGVLNGPLVVGSSAWQAWLAGEGADHRTFTFPAADGDGGTGAGLHRALREWRREQPYWYVKVRIGPAIKRFYLGTPADLDGGRLETVAANIAEARRLACRPVEGTRRAGQAWPSARLTVTR